jgi:lipopolysaccharide biosynthesis regulator YciM
MSDASLRLALQALVDDRMSHFGVYDPCLNINDLEVLLEEHVPTVVRYKCEHCGYPDDNADSDYWRCSICGSGDWEANP